VQTITAATVIQQARYHADAETPSPTVDFITDAEALSYLTDSYHRLLDFIMDCSGQDLLATSATLSAPYTLPADFYRAIALDVQNGSGVQKWVSLRPFMFRERNNFVDTSFPRWRILGNNPPAILFEPETAAPSVIRLWYVQDVSALSSTAAVLSNFGGWADYLAYDVAVAMLIKEEREPGACAAEAGSALKRIELAVKNKCLGETDTVARVEYAPEDLIDVGYPNYFRP
jgi:hypothetical protein